MLYPELQRQLERDEGRRDRGYQDSVGIWTIGIGHNVQPGLPIPNSAIDVIFESDLKHALDTIATAFPWAMTLDPVRHGVLVNMIFNMGLPRLMTFKIMLQALSVHDWDLASKELLNSQYAIQVGDRAHRLARQLRTGTWQ